MGWITDCDPWTVKDVAAHVLGWGELAMSWSEFRHQMAAALRGWRSNPVHAQNALQVEERAHLSPEDVVTRLEIALPALLRLRRRLSLPGRLVPFYNPLLGVTTLGFVADMIFTRDVLAHRIDVSISAGTEISGWPPRSKGARRLHPALDPDHAGEPEVRTRRSPGGQLRDGA